MKIIGIGTDIVEIERIQRLIKGVNDRFVQRILHKSELQRFQQLPENLSAHWLAKRFATKEACAKALGTGIGQYAQFTEFETRHDELGKPSLILHGTARETATQLGVTEMSVSLSDERKYAVAFVVFSGK